jgi:hypothetical protein
MAGRAKMLAKPQVAAGGGHQTTRARKCSTPSCSLRPRTTPTGQAWPAWSTTCLPTTYATASRRPSTRSSYKGNEHLRWTQDTRCRMVCLEPTSGPTSLALKAEAVIARIEGLFDKQAAHQPPSTGRGVQLPSAPLAAVVDQTRDASVSSSAHHPYQARNRPAAGQGSATASPAEVSDAAPAGRAVEVSRRQCRHCSR